MASQEDAKLGSPQVDMGIHWASTGHLLRVLEVPVSQNKRLDRDGWISKRLNQEKMHFQEKNEEELGESSTASLLY